MYQKPFRLWRLVPSAATGKKYPDFAKGLGQAPSPKPSNPNRKLYAVKPAAGPQFRVKGFGGWGKVYLAYMAKPACCRFIL